MTTSQNTRKKTKPIGKKSHLNTASRPFNATNRLPRAASRLRATYECNKVDPTPRNAGINGAKLG